MRNFIADDTGQDLIEYTLLLAFIALGTAALMAGAGDSTQDIWTKAKSTLARAAEIARGRPRGDD
jgi:Flp pilus assembly pilin Flp